MEFRNGYGDVSVREWLLQKNEDDFPTPKKCVHAEGKSENCELFSSPFSNWVGTNVKNKITNLYHKTKWHEFIYFLLMYFYLKRKI